MKTASTATLTMLLVLLLSACASSPDSRFYTLTATASQGVPAIDGKTPSIAIVSLTIPELVDRPQLVARTSVSRVELLETHRWAEPLKSAIARTIAENLSRLLASDRVSYYPQAASLFADFKVYVDLSRFEFVGDHVELDAYWTIRRADDSPDGSGRSQLREVVTGSGYDAVAQAFSRGIAGISLDVAKELKRNGRSDAIPFVLPLLR